MRLTQQSIRIHLSLNKHQTLKLKPRREPEPSNPDLIFKHERRTLPVQIPPNCLRLCLSEGACERQEG